MSLGAFSLTTDPGLAAGAGSLERILVPFHDAALTTCLLWQVEDLLRETECELLLLPLEVESGQLGEVERARRLEGANRLQQLLSGSGIPTRLVFSRSEEAGSTAGQEEVVELVQREGPGLVLLTAEPNRPAKLTPLLQRLRVPLLVFHPEGPLSSFRRLLVPLDGSRGAEAILPLVTLLAGAGGSLVILLHVQPGPPAPGEEVHAEPLRHGQEAVERARQALAEQGLEVEVRVAQSQRTPAEAILEAAELEGADAVAMTTHGRNALDRWLYGSVAEHVLRECQLPLVVKRIAGTPTLVEPTPPPQPTASAVARGWTGDPSQRWRHSLERVLVPVDGSAFSQRVVVTLPGLLQGQASRVTLLSVVEDDPSAEPSEVRQALREAEESLADLVRQLAKSEIQARARVLRGDPAERILQLAHGAGPMPGAGVGDDEGGFDLVVLASHGHSGVTRWVRGSVAERVLRRCQRPLLVCTPASLQREAVRAGEALRTILVPSDGSEHANAILPLVEDLARLHEAEVVLLRVTGDLDPEADPQTLRQSLIELRASLDSERDRLQASGIRTRSEVRLGAEVERILQAAERADLLAMSTHGRGGVARFMFGSIAEGVLRRCTRPLLVLRAPER